MRFIIRVFFLVTLMFVSYYGKTQNKTVTDLDSLIINSVRYDSVSEYYALIFDAEREITKNNFDKAADKYFKAFNYCKIPFQKDLFYALDCELLSLTPDTSRLIYCVENLMRKNVGKDFFESYDLYKNLILIPEIKEILDSVKMVSDTAFVRQIEDIVAKDQAIREKSRKENNDIIYNDNYNDTIKYIDSVNYFHLVKLIEERGFISEEIYGGYENWRKILTIFLHNPERKEILPLLLESVMQGYFDVRLFTSVLKPMGYKYDDKYPLQENGFYINGKFFWVERYDRKALTEINKLRKCIYLDKYQNQMKKIDWSVKNSSYGFVFNSLATQLYMPEDQYYPIVLDYVNRRKSKTLLFFRNDEQEKEIIRKAREWNSQKN